MSKTLESLQKEIILESKKGYPILLAGAIVFLIYTVMHFIFPIKAVHLIWIFGLSVIFPVGILIGKNCWC